jgi:hypothetical protein
MSLLSNLTFHWQFTTLLIFNRRDLGKIENVLFTFLYQFNRPQFDQARMAKETKKMASKMDDNVNIFASRRFGLISAWQSISVRSVS